MTAKVTSVPRCISLHLILFMSERERQSVMRCCAPPDQDNSRFSGQCSLITSFICLVARLLPLFLLFKILHDRLFSVSHRLAISRIHGDGYLAGLFSRSLDAYSQVNLYLRSAHLSSPPFATLHVWVQPSRCLPASQSCLLHPPPEHLPQPLDSLRALAIHRLLQQSRLIS